MERDGPAPCNSLTANLRIEAQASFSTIRRRRLPCSFYTSYRIHSPLGGTSGITSSLNVPVSRRNAYTVSKFSSYTSGESSISGLGLGAPSGCHIRSSPPFACWKNGTSGCPLYCTLEFFQLCSFPLAARVMYVDGCGVLSDPLPCITCTLAGVFVANGDLLEAADVAG